MNQRAHGQIDFKEQSMVDWYDIGELFRSFYQESLSKQLGSFLDRREMQSCLGQQEALQSSLQDRSATAWIDFISDTGDGFQSTYSIAQASASSHTLAGETLERPSVVVFGGDEVYPTATYEDYHHRFRGPFQTAFSEGQPVDLYAIPGNHDWYDGLTSFLRLFCQKRRFGKLRTHQTRSYFALQIRPHLWLWALDNQLSGNYDAPQKDYFANIAKNQMSNGDQVILVTSQPCWVEMESWRENYLKSLRRSPHQEPPRQLEGKRTNYHILSWFIHDYIDNARGRIGPGDDERRRFELLLVLTGDLHHYSRYSGPRRSDGAPFHLITAGGGGSFTHATHNLPAQAFDLSPVEHHPSAEALHERNDELFSNSPITREGFVTRQICYPNEQQSRELIKQASKLGWSRALKPRSLPLVFGILLLLSAASMQTLISLLEIPTGSLNLRLGLAAVISWGPLLGAHGLGWFGFGERHWTGALHGLAQIALVGLMLAGLAYPGFCLLCKLAAVALYPFPAGGLLGLYLAWANLSHKQQDNNASAFLSSEDYKCFLRIKLEEEQLTIYPLKIDRPGKWTAGPEGYRNQGGSPVELIEAPIVVPFGKRSQPAAAQASSGE